MFTIKTQCSRKRFVSFFGTSIFRLTALILVAMLLVGTAQATLFVPTRRDTKIAPPAIEIEQPLLDHYTLLYETSFAQYYWREDRDIIAVVDKQNGYTWKTGGDIGFSKAIKDAAKNAKTPEEKLLAAEPIEKSMNATYIGVANSLVTIEYHDGKIFYLGSAAEKGANSTLSKVEGANNKFTLSVDFSEIDLQLQVDITLLEKGITYEVPYERITGKGRAVFTALWITPFLGASGGEAEYYDPETEDWGEAQAKPIIPGYALVPDGSGALIRFQDNTVPFAEYIGDVFGMDYATEKYYYQRDTDALALKDPLMPVFGIAHGDRQAAFVAYAQQGAEYLDIVMRPDENLRLKYNFCYPRFEYNLEYYKVYNRKGSGYFTKAEDLFEYNAKITYEFLHGDGADGSPAADYTGMALKYRQHLMDNGVLTPKDAPKSSDIPLRLDFIISDMKKSLVGHEQVVTTTFEDVVNILDEVQAQGIENINSGLIGWQSGAETLAKPDAWRFNRTIGRQGDVEALFKRFLEQGVDISLARDYSLINGKMTNYLNTAAKHINTWYIGHNKEDLFSGAPVTEFAYALPTVASGWLNSVADKAKGFSASISVSGITNTLVSSYDRLGVALTLQQSMQVYREAFKKVKQNMKLNLSNPNVYLWEYADRFLDAPVGSSQYVFVTDEVPFLQMVLHGTMEVYGPYSNFSFYTQEDILRMIDYNISPAFILSRQPSHLLSDTLSSALYSTEYEQYRGLIQSIYAQVNAALSQVSGFEWTGRKVVENGLVVNSYQQGDSTKEIAINYTLNPMTYQGYEIAPQTAIVMEGVKQP